MKWVLIGDQVIDHAMNSTAQAVINVFDSFLRFRIFLFIIFCECLNLCCLFFSGRASFLVLREMYIPTLTISFL